MDNRLTRRGFLEKLALAAGGVVLMPAVSACSSAPETRPETMPSSKPAGGNASAPAAMPEVPKEKPAGWDAVAYNKKRGNAGAIPESYLGKVNGADGDAKHLGKHLPYVPSLDEGMVPAGFIALMWGDPSKGHAKHPNAPKTDANPDGHWYNWIRIRKAVSGDVEELQSAYSDWPGIQDGDNGSYAVFGGGDIKAEGGRNTVYLAKLPADVKPGDTVRVYAHCLTHGEYVDFLTIPA